MSRKSKNCHSSKSIIYGSSIFLWICVGANNYSPLRSEISKKILEESYLCKGNGLYIKNRFFINRTGGYYER